MDSYRYGFQGQEKDDELKGEGNSLNYTFRMHDPRVGRFFARDPLEFKYPELTPYQFSSNTPILAIELEGLETGFGDHTSARYYGSSAYLNASTAKRNEVATCNGIGAVVGLTILIDAVLTKGKLTKAVIAYNLGDLYHSAQMQSHYRAQGDEVRAKQYEAEGAEASKALFIEGVCFVGSKLVGKIIDKATKAKVSTKIFSEEARIRFSIGKKGIGDISLNNGVLCMDLNVPKNLQGQGIGEGMFKKALNFFGDEIKAIKGHWVEGTNLEVFNKIYKETKNFNEAVFSTPTGKWAERAGYTEVKLNGSHADESGMTGMEVIFTKPKTN